jgi:hypothetical protein
VTIEACRLARSLGCRYAVLNSTEMGEGVYRRIGFESLGYGQTWWMHQARLEAGPPSEWEVALAESVGWGDTARLDRLASGLDPESLEHALPCGLTPLGLAAQTSQPAAAEWLLQHRAGHDIVAA